MIEKWQGVVFLWKVFRIRWKEGVSHVRDGDRQYISTFSKACALCIIFDYEG